MGFFDKMREHRAGLTGRESVATLDHMEQFFKGGQNWTQNTYHAPNGTKCLVGAADHVRVSAVDDAKHWLRVAIAEREPAITTIEGFNDSRQSFGEIEAVISRAKELAASANRLAVPARAAALPASAKVAALPAPVPAAEIQPARSLAYQPPAPLPFAMPRAVRQPVAAPARRNSLIDWFMSD